MNENHIQDTEVQYQDSDYEAEEALRDFENQHCDMDDACCNTCGHITEDLWRGDCTGQWICTPCLRMADDLNAME